MNDTRVRKTIAIRATGLRSILDDRGIRYVWLARKAGISKSHMSHVIAGQVNVNPAHAELICAALDVPFSVAFGFIDRSNMHHQASGQP